MDWPRGRLFPDMTVIGTDESGKCKLILTRTPGLRAWFQFNTIRATGPGAETWANGRLGDSASTSGLDLSPGRVSRVDLGSGRHSLSCSESPDNAKCESFCSAKEGRPQIGISEGLEGSRRWTTLRLQASDYRPVRSLPTSARMSVFPFLTSQFFLISWTQKWCSVTMCCLALHISCQSSEIVQSVLCSQPQDFKGRQSTPRFCWYHDGERVTY